jgi:pimeloyl-ACP methyl ester carboxylesterase
VNLDIDGRAVFASTGGKEHDPTQPLIVFLHGAAMDHSVWALQSRWFAHHGANALAVDLPGHGRSAGPALTDIAALADWTDRLIAIAGGGGAWLVGHSMGALIALETAARHPIRAERLSLVGTAAKILVQPGLLAAAKANSHSAVDMVSLWGLGGNATLGGNEAPGVWMLGNVQRLLEKAPPGVLHTDLAACDAYGAGAESATKVACPTSLILGERDMMTPIKGGRALAALIGGAKTTVLSGAGHMLMTERPGEVLEALNS